ncbi:hypothetical protein BAJUN_00820 [Bajunvirus bajun]|uniref:Uncharacterized protein n=1 Tax=Brevundimonas phage vB_BgoS-Bajun TaxID=2948594 RepID=A0A9E7N759_9CAUD|nr:hypothetical protein BAJUN_00820 [Brevundimonas phage vB_BgoS-Bajun]
MSDITSIMLGCFCHVRQKDSPTVLRGFITHVDPAWMNVAEFTPLLADRRKAGLGPLCFAGLAKDGPRIAFEPQDAVYDALLGGYILDFAKVIAFTSDAVLIIQRGQHGRR